MELIDTHCHLDHPRFRGREHQLLREARKKSVHSLVLPGVYRDWWPDLFSLCRQHHGLYAAPGLHPLYLHHHRPEHLQELNELCQNERVVAIGEIGLDYYVTGVSRTQQQELFEKQLHLAKIYKLPILLHVRKAHDQVVSTIRKSGFPHGGIVHAFNGSIQQAKKYIEQGFALGIGGTITYSRALKIRATTAVLPKSSIVLETDAPDIVVANHRGEENLPQYLPDILKELAILRNEDPTYTARYTTENVKRLLSLS